jgi:hypothetical protein
MGSVYKQPEREVDDSYHNWRVPSKYKGTQRGAKENQQGVGKANGNVPCIYVIVLYVQRNVWTLNE